MIQSYLSAINAIRLRRYEILLFPLCDGTMMVKPVLDVPPRGFALIKNFMHLFQVFGKFITTTKRGSNEIKLNDAKHSVIIDAN